MFLSIFRSSSRGESPAGGSSDESSSTEGGESGRNQHIAEVYVEEHPRVGSDMHVPRSNSFTDWIFINK